MANTTIKNIELLAPAGSFASLQAAIQAKTNSIYFGIGQLNMRAGSSNNFKEEDIDTIVSICKKNNIKAYLAINTILYDEDLSSMKRICDIAKEKNVDAIIASDISVLMYAKSINLPVHISTQLNISNIDEIKFFSKFADVIVLARELKLEQIKNICRKIEEEKITGPSGNLVKIEIFIHGALCVAISGRCYMSLSQYNYSANRGVCLQACRRKYRVIEEETNKELLLDNKYVMSPKDLCTIAYLEEIINSKASILKIEGRGRKEEYVYRVVKTYKEAIDYICKGNKPKKEKIEGWVKELQSVYNRGFWHGGYYLNKSSKDMWSLSYGSKATKKKIYIGKVTNYFSKKQIAEVLIEAHILKTNDEIIISGNTTGVVFETIKDIWIDNKSHKQANKKDVVTIPITTKVRKNDKLYIYG